MNVLTVDEARQLSDMQLNVEIGKRCEQLEKLGMSFDEAVSFVATLLSLGGAATERFGTK